MIGEPKSARNGRGEDCSRLLGSGKPASAKSVKELRRLLGDDVILIPVQYGGKNPLEAIS